MILTLNLLQALEICIAWILSSYGSIILAAACLVCGRVDALLVSYTTPSTLSPGDYKVSFLITKHVHAHGHEGVAITTAKIRTKYWILKRNKMSKKIKKQCVFCKRLAHQTETQLMLALPQIRLAPHTPPFFHISCDHLFVHQWAIDH